MGFENCLKTISGHKPTPQAAGDSGWMNDLNQYFNRFDLPPTPPLATFPILQPPSPLRTACFSSHAFTPLQSQPSHPPSASEDSILHPPLILSLSTLQVRNELRKIKMQKAAGPDVITSRLMRCCANELCGILACMFNLSQKLGKGPQLWRTSFVYQY